MLGDNDQFMIFAEQGTGKTLPMLYHISNLFMQDDIKSGLIVAPKSAMGAWIRDIEKLPKGRRKYFDNVEIVNYDKFSRKTSKTRIKYEEGVDIVVLDEGHAIKNQSSNRTKYFIGHNVGRGRVVGLNQKSKYRYILTGTPITNGKLHEFYGLMEFVKPGLLKGYREFEAHFCVTRKIPGTFINFVVAYRNKEELMDIVGKVSYRVLKKDCLDLPDKLPDEVIYCDLLEKTIYKEAEKHMAITIFESAIKTPMTLLGKLRQICSGFYIDEYKEIHLLKSEKPKMLEELVESIGKKVVIFYYYGESYNQISKVLTKMKLKFVSLNGQQKNKNIWRDFQADDSIQVIVCQYKSGEAGIDLYKSSHTIYYEPHISSTTLEQSRDRTHRIGVNDHCNYYFLITKGTMEEKIYNRLANYEDFTADYLRKMYERK